MKVVTIEVGDIIEISKNTIGDIKINLLGVVNSIEGSLVKAMVDKERTLSVYDSNRLNQNYEIKYFKSKMNFELSKEQKLEYVSKYNKEEIIKITKQAKDHMVSYGIKEMKNSIKRLLMLLDIDLKSITDIKGPSSESILYSISKELSSKVD